MAVENKYVNSATEAGNRTPAFATKGTHQLVVTQTFEVAAADDDGSVYRLFKGVPSTTVIDKFEIMNDAITGGTNYDLGVYETNNSQNVDGAVVDKDLFGEGIDMSSARARTAALVLGTPTTDVAVVGQDIRTLLALSLDDVQKSYDIALTADTVGTGAGTITVRMFISHQA